MNKKEQADKEMQEIINWSIAEEDRIISELKNAGEWKPGLDGVVPELEKHRKEYHKRMGDLMEKYGDK